MCPVLFLSNQLLQKMEYINQHINIKITSESSIKESCYISNQDDESISVEFYLSSNDCLFEVANNKNKVAITIEKKYFLKYATPFQIVAEKQNKIKLNNRS